MPRRRLAACGGEGRGWARENEILVNDNPRRGSWVCDHAGLVINKFFGAAVAAVLTHAIDYADGVPWEEKVSQICKFGV